MTNNQADSANSVNQSAVRPPSRRSATLRFLRDVVVILLAAVVISFLIKTFLVRSFYIPSESMESTLLVNDRIIVNELVPSIVPVAHGDVIVFRDPGGWIGPPKETEPWSIVQLGEWLLSVVGLAAPDSDEHLIKRVIGLPGDTVACCDEYGRLLLNGVPIEEPYIHVPEGDPASKTTFEVTVPEDSLWVMGDNRNHSSDSRAHTDGPGQGFVPIEDVVGRAVVISWPIGRWTWLDNYPLTFEGADPSGSD